jgi:ADP-ribose pyrophosphatase YjhB (NUDIX family)
MTKVQQATLLFLIKSKNDKPSQICLAMKKRGFGVGKWNGVGGKINDSDKSIKDTAIRETIEEINVVPKNLKRVATLTFEYPLHADCNQIVYAYITDKWDGTPTESEEMRPKWFNVSDIPFSQMWPDDKYWIPEVLSGKLIKAKFVFGENNEILEKYIEFI